MIAAIWVAWLATSVSVGLAVRALAPAAGPLVAALVAVAVLSVGAAALVRRDPVVRALLAAGPRRWTAPAWLVLPAVLAAFPLVTGLHLPDARTLAVLVAGYALTGFAEEAVWRGTVLERLRPAGPWRAVLVSALLFGLLHLGNVVYRDSTGLVVMQAWGAFCHGVGYAAIRLRTRALWPLMVTHALTDLAPRISGLSGLGVYVVQDAVLLLAGLWLTARLARGGVPGPVARLRPEPAEVSDR